MLGENFGWFWQNMAPVIAGWAGGAEQQAATDRANAQNEFRYGQAASEAMGLRDRLMNQTYADEASYLPWLSQNLTGLADQSAYLGDNIAQGYGNLRNDAMGNYNAGSNRVDYGYDSLAGNVGNMVSGGYGDLRGQYGDRTNRAMSYLEGSGAQQRADIDERFQGIGSQLEADLVGRGLNSSTVLGSTRRGVERERSAEQRRLEEGLRREYLDAYGTFSGQDLAAQERGINEGAGYASSIGMAGLGARERMNQEGLRNNALLTEAMLNAQERGGVRTLGYDTESVNSFSDALRQFQNQRASYDMYGTGALTDLIGQRSDVAPQMNPYLYAQQAFQNYRGGDGGGGGGGSSDAWIGPAITGGTALAGAGLASLGSGAGLGATIGMGKAMVMFCIDGDSQFETKQGKRRLAELRIGDKVKSSDGQFKEIVFLDYGNPDESRMNDYLTITTDLSTITVTKDHIIEDKPAGEWKEGDRMRTPKGHVDVVSIHPAVAYPSGDILLEDGSDYIASGFYVGSMISRVGTKECHTK